MKNDGKPEKEGAENMKPTSAGGRAERAVLPTQIQAQIGRRLSAIYDEILQQQIPDRFRALLDELENGASAVEAKARGREKPELTELVRAAKRDLSSRSGSGPKGDLLTAIPALRAFAVSLSGNADRDRRSGSGNIVEGMGKYVVIRAGIEFAAHGCSRSCEIPSTRNTANDVAKRKARIPRAGRCRPPVEQIAHLDFADFRKALHQLPPDQREALHIDQRLGIFLRRGRRFLTAKWEQ